MWQNYFDKIFVINLPKRIDRKERMFELMYEYNISVYFWEATSHEKGYFGLVLTMKSLFEFCLKRGYKKVLVFEDDVKFLEGVESFNTIMDKCINGLKKLDWAQFYLGIQHSKPFHSFVTPNILHVTCGYSTHAVAYDERAMKFLVEKYIDEPIDNFFVREFQPFGLSYCAYPLLATQEIGYSDINMEVVDWDMYISSSYRKSIVNLFGRKGGN